jgi:uncharacterized protein
MFAPFSLRGAFPFELERQMIRWRWIWFSLGIAILIAAWPASQRLSFDRTLHRMFAPGAPVRTDFEFLQSRFGVSDLVVFAYRDESLWSADGRGLERLKGIRERIESVSGVAIAMDLSKVDQMLGQLNQGLAIFSQSQKKAHSHALLDDTNALAQEFKTIFEGQTHSRDGKLVAIACLLKPANQSLGTAKETLAELRKIAVSLESEGLSKGMLVGQPVMVEEGFDEIELDGRRLSVVSTVCLALLIWIGFRSLRWAMISILIVQWSLIVTRGLLAWLAWDLTMVSSMLASIVTVIGVATTMHWMLGYQQEMRQQTSLDGSSPEVALRTSMRNLWRPIMWACITDAIGFASLAFAKVGPIQDYGCMMALASIVVLLGIFVLIPSLALVPLAPDLYAKRLGLSYDLFQIPGDEQLRDLLLLTLRGVCKFPWTVSSVSIGVCILAVWGSLRLKVETDFIKNFRQDAPLVLAYRAVESELGGAGVWDIVLPAPKVLSQKYLDQVTALEQCLLTLVVPGEEPLRLTKVMSFADADQASRSSPILSNLSIEARLLGMRQVMGSFVDTLITKPSNGPRYLRIMLRSREQAESKQKEQLIAEVRQKVDEAIRTEQWQKAMDQSQAKGMVSGYYLLLSQLVSSIVEDQWRCFAVATIGIWIAMTIALRSSWLALLTILPNALPSLCILGWMGWSGTRVNLGAAMIAAVSMGLSVDSSLHYLIRFRRERNEGKSFDEALIAAQSEIGMAMLLSTFALVLGFGSLAVSNFLPTVVFGTTASISMVGGLLCNLAVLPALLRLSERRGSKRRARRES